MLKLPSSLRMVSSVFLPSGFLPSALLLSVLIVLLVSGCGGGQGRYSPTGVIVQSIEGVAGDDFEGASATGLGDDEIYETVGSDVTGEPLAQQKLYFEYNSSKLSNEYKAIVQAHAEYLVRATDVKVVLEGHADERGTREYNLALAEDRANTIANILKAWGVRVERIRTVSYGEERPAELDHDENAWYYNRRVEIIYQ